MRISKQQEYYRQKNPAFKMTVRFAVSDYANDLKSELKQTLSPNEMAGWPYTIKYMAKGSDKLLTLGACDCNVIGISNGKEAIMAHLIPDKLNLDNISDLSKPASLKRSLVNTLQKNINLLKKDGKSISAFLTGGQAWEDDARRSISLFKGLYAFLEENDIRPTILWGQRTGCAELDAIYSVKDDTLTVLPNPMIMVQNLTSKFIKDYFEFIRFNPEDKVLIKNTRQKKSDFIKDNIEIFNKARIVTCDYNDF